MTLQDLTQYLEGELQGEPCLEIKRVRGIEQAETGDICLLKDSKYLRLNPACKASAFLIGAGIAADRPTIKVKNPLLSFARLIELFYPRQTPPALIDPRAVMGKDVRLGQEVSLQANVVLGNGVEIGDKTCLYPNVVVGESSRIGKNCLIYANVTIYGGVTIGNNVIIHSGAVLGSDGFGFTPTSQGKHYKIPQVGGVLIEDEVEIGANVCIDRATLGSTIIRKGTKLDNLIQVAHNVIIGEDSVIAAQTGISGSSRLGKAVRIGGQVGIADHVSIGDKTVLIAQSGVSGNLKSGIYAGSPAAEHRRWQKAQVALLRLPELLKEIRKLKKKLLPGDKD